MDSLNYRIKNEEIEFKKLSNAQDICKITKIFAKNKPNYILKPQPYMVILVGSPGVGKTSKAHDFLDKELHLNYNNFYTISLDSLVEKVTPYRNTTISLYKDIKNIRKSEELRDENFGILSEVYLPTVMSEDNDFKLDYTHKRIKNKIEGKTKTVSVKNKSLKNKTIKNKTIKNKDTNKDTNKDSKLLSLNDLRKEGLIYAVKNGLNILYDTTLASNKDKIKTDIMPILEKYSKDVKYNIVVIHITAEIDDILIRIKQRHKKMLEEKDPYIRAIYPRLIKKYVEENKVAFDKAKEYYEAGLYKTENPKTIYEASDFTFKEIINKHRNKSFKLKQN
jgi:hypothetical protein